MAANSAHAQSASVSADKLERLEAQIESLQAQVKELKGQVTRTERTYRRAPAPAAAPAAIMAPPATAMIPMPMKAAAPAPAIKMTWGGFLAAETVWRQRNEVADVGSNFGAIPYPFSPLYDEHEFHGSARQSRLSLLVEGSVDPVHKLSGYYEMDFLGVGTTSNYNQSNSWAPRLRQAYLTYDDTGWGFDLLAGQSWSLLTQDQVGITPRKENIPLTIDASYVPGFNYTRNWQIRAVKNFGSTAAFGISIENPATIVGASTAAAATGLGGTFASGGIVNGLDINFNNPGGSFLSTQTITTDQFPDIVEKAAFDPGWGHYEIFGLQRFFSDSVLTCVGGPCVVGSTTQTGSASEKTSFGAGIGGSAYVPLIPKYLEFTGNVMYGKGVGRYAAGQLPDVTIAADGSLTPLTELTAMVGLIGHPWEGLDVYGYAGFEQSSASSFTAGGTIFGYGASGFSNAGCVLTTPASFSGATPSSCIANNRTLAGVTAGFWHNVYKGSYGRLAVGGEYEYIRREAFAGLGGTPATDDNIVLTSLRYYPW